MTGGLPGGWALLPPAALLAGGLALASAFAPLVALGALVAIVLAFLVLTRPQALMLVLVAALPWEGLLGYPSPTLSLVKVLGLLLAAAYLLRVLGGREEIYVPRTLTAVAVFGLLVGVSLLFAPDLLGSLTKAVSHALFIGFFFFAVQLTPNRMAVVRAMRVVVVSATLAALWGLYAFLTGDVERAGGPIADPNDFAYLMAALLPMPVYLMAAGGRHRVLWGASFLILSAGVLATLSRGALVGLGCLAVWALVTRRVSPMAVFAGVATALALAGLAFVFAGPLVQQRLNEKQHIASENVDSRFAFWEAAVRMAADDPLVGVGPGGFADEAGRYGTGFSVLGRSRVVHNSYLEILAENGVPAFIAFFAFLAGTWRLLAEALRSAVETGDREGRRLATTMQATLVVAIVGATFLSVQLFTPFWLIGALATAVARGVDAPDRSTIGSAVRAPRPALAR